MSGTSLRRLARLGATRGVDDRLAGDLAQQGRKAHGMDRLGDDRVGIGGEGGRLRLLIHANREEDPLCRGHQLRELLESRDRRVGLLRVVDDNDVGLESARPDR